MKIEELQKYILQKQYYCELDRIRNFCRNNYNGVLTYNRQSQWLANYMHELTYYNHIYFKKYEGDYKSPATGRVLHGYWWIIDDTRIDPEEFLRNCKEFVSAKLNLLDEEVLI